jgi:hypothetical protein
MMTRTRIAWILVVALTFLPVFAELANASTVTFADSGHNFNCASSVLTCDIDSSYTPPASKVILVCIAAQMSTGSTSPVLTGAGMTWHKAKEQFASFSSLDNWATCWYSENASPTSTALHVDYASGAGSACIQGLIMEVTGSKITGTDGSDAIGNVCGSTGAGTSSSCTISSNPAGDGTAGFGMFEQGWSGSPNLTAGTGFTALAERGRPSACNVGTEASSSNLTTSAYTNGSSQNWLQVGVAIVCDVCSGAATAIRHRGIQD